MVTLSPGSFFVSGLHEPVMGFSNETSWNGFACPYFAKEDAAMILESVGATWKYTDGQFVVYEAHAISEKVSGVKCEVEGKQVTLYPIGSFSWAWEQVS